MPFRFPGRRTPDPTAPPPAAEPHPTPAATPVPVIIVLRHERLDRVAALAFLRAHATGTIAFMHRGRLVVEPASCVLDPDFDEWLYLRALPGSVLSAEDANQRVAVTVRTEQSPTDWTMAIVYGRLVPLPARGGEASPRVHAHAADLLQPSAPDLATASAEAREEETFYRVSVDMLHARSCRAEVQEGTPPAR
jgi:nitroimidazol reductase NimA-like FMN-containing flavoprotein (pyridoxamine 5'-phosphate oxidase superfamily)